MVFGITLQRKAQYAAILIICVRESKIIVTREGEVARVDEVIG